MKVAQQKQHANHNQDCNSELDDDDEHGIKRRRSTGQAHVKYNVLRARGCNQTPDEIRRR
jgi:hypothetical protein